MFQKSILFSFSREKNLQIKNPPFIFYFFGLSQLKIYVCYEIRAEDLYPQSFETERQ